MNKRQSNRALSRPYSQRKALLLSLAKSLFLKGKIQTTEAKAKEAARFAEKLVTEAKKGTVASRRRLSMLTRKEALALQEHAKSVKDRKGGYTRVIKLGPRMSDGARIAILELVK